jgi:hypothetical protein
MSEVRDAQNACPGRSNVGASAQTTTSWDIERQIDSRLRRAATFYHRWASPAFDA